MKYKIKAEYSNRKFINFTVEGYIVDGVVEKYTYTSFVDDIRKRCGSLIHRYLRIRYRDEDGDYVNLYDDKDNFTEMFVRAKSEDEGSYGEIVLKVSELDSPVVQPVDQAAKKRKLFESFNTLQIETDRNLEPRSLEASFTNAALKSAAQPEKSPLDHVKRELEDNIQLKKALLLSAQEELQKATRKNESLTAMSTVRARLCGICHTSGHTKPKCSSYPCPSSSVCGIRDKHPELKLTIAELQKEIKRLQREFIDAESKLKAFSDSRTKASTSFFALMRPRLKVRNLIKYSDRVYLDRDLLILEKALNGKIPEFDASQDWQLPLIIEQYRNSNIDAYLNRPTLNPTPSSSTSF